MKKFISYLIRFTLFLSVIVTLGLFALTSSKPAISETPKIKIQKRVQELDSTEPSQLIEMMAKDLHDKQVKARAIMKDAVENIDDTNTDTNTSAHADTETHPAEDVKAMEEAPAEAAPVEAVVAAASPKKIEKKRLGDIYVSEDTSERVSEDTSEPSQAPAIKTKSSTIIWGKTMLSLVFVLSLIGVLAAVVKKYVLPMQNQKSINHFGGSIQILQSMVIGLKQQIMVVLVEGHRLVIGVSDHSMNLLYTIPNTAEVRDTEASAPQEVIRPVTVQPSTVAAAPEKAEIKEKKTTPPSVFPEEVMEALPQEDPLSPLAKIVTQAPQNQFADHAFRKKLEAFERYQADQAHIASLREKVREQMAAFSQRRETGEPVSNNVSQKIRAAMRTMKSFNGNQQDRGNAY